MSSTSDINTLCFKCKLLPGTDFFYFMVPLKASTKCSSPRGGGFNEQGVHTHPAPPLVDSDQCNTATQQYRHALPYGSRQEVQFYATVRFAADTASQTASETPLEKSKGYFEKSKFWLHFS